MPTFSHANCDHPSTPAARKKCRDNQKKIADGKIKDTKSVRELQHSLTEAFREQLLNIGDLTTSQIKDMLEDMSTADVDKWFSGELPKMMKVVQLQHKEAMLLTTSYLKEHAALLGYTAGKLETIAPVWEQISTSLEVTGPVAFKIHIAAGGTAAAAKEVMKTTLSGSAERLVLQGSRDTLAEAIANPASNVLGYSRQTSGSPCDYCRGLSREAVYDSNTFHAHDHCTCTGEPIYLDPRFLPNAAQADYDRDWDNALDTRQKALDLDAAQHEFDFVVGGHTNETALNAFGPSLVWRNLVDGEMVPGGFTPGIRDAFGIRSKAKRMEKNDDPDTAAWLRYAEALREYTSETYDSMNRVLRGLPRAAHRLDNQVDSSSYLSDWNIENLNKNLLAYYRKEAVGLPEDVRLYRGVKDANLVFGKYANDDLSGMVFTDKGFTSTTLNEVTANQFITNAHEGKAAAPLMMRIIGKKGTKVVGGNSFEAEVLFAPGVRYRVIRDYARSNTMGTGKARWLDVEVIDSVEEMAQKIESIPKEVVKEFDQTFADLEKAVKEFEKAAKGLDGTDSLYEISKSLAGEEEFSLMADASDAFSYYVDDGYSGMNKYLRENIVEYASDLNHVKALQKYFESARVKVMEQDVAAYRGVKSMWKVFGKDWEKSLKGVEFTDKGFFSVSTNKEIAENFAKSGLANNKERAVFRVIVPKGQKALKGNDSESEIVLAPGTKFKVVKDWEKNGIRTIDLEVIL